MSIYLPGAEAGNDPRLAIPAAQAWLARAIGAPARELDITRLKGSTSSSVFLVRLARDRAPQPFVLRVLDNPAWLAEEPDLAEHEAAALEEARRAGLRAPRLVAFAGRDAASEAGFGAPVVLMTYLEGEIDLRPPAAAPADFERWLAGLAGELAVIHRHSAPGFGWHYRSWVDHSALAPPAGSAQAAVWEHAIERVHSPAPDARAVFIHRDYHPTNILWQGGGVSGSSEVSGVVDWINACQGPAGVDVAHCRTNLALMYGAEIADRFLAAYRAAAPDFEYDPYWDIDSMLDCCLPRPTFYPPWRDFGLGVIPPDILQRRADAHLAAAVARL